MSSQGRAEEEDRDDIQVDDKFDDIKKAVKVYKKKLRGDRNELYSLDGVPSEDILRLYRTRVINWKFFFHRMKLLEQAEAEKESITVVEEDSGDEYDEEETLGSSHHSDSTSEVKGRTAMSTWMENFSLNSMPESFKTLPDPLGIIISPLPHGKILESNRLRPWRYKYFQVEVAEKLCIVTIEVTCKRGQATLYVSKEAQLPTSTMFDLKVTTTM